MWTKDLVLVHAYVYVDLGEGQMSEFFCFSFWSHDSIEQWLNILRLRLMIIVLNY